MWYTSKLGISYKVQNYGIFFGQLNNKLAVTHTNANKLKEKYDTMVVISHHVACVC